MVWGSRRSEDYCLLEDGDTAGKEGGPDVSCRANAFRKNRMDKGVSRNFKTLFERSLQQLLEKKLISKARIRARGGGCEQREDGERNDSPNML